MLSEEERKRILGIRIRKARITIGLKQGELAEKVGVTQAVISTVENGVSTITVPELYKWAEALERPVLYFIEDESVDIRESALAILSRFPESQLQLVLYMLRGMADGMRSDMGGLPFLKQTLREHFDDPEA